MNDEGVPEDREVHCTGYYNTLTGDHTYNYNILSFYTDKNGTVDVRGYNPPYPNFSLVSMYDKECEKSGESTSEKEARAECTCSYDASIQFTLEMVDGGPPIVTSWSHVGWWTPQGSRATILDPKRRWRPFFVCDKLKKVLVAWLCTAKRAGIPRDLALVVCEWAVNADPCIYNFMASKLHARDVTFPADTPVMVYNKKWARITLTDDGYAVPPLKKKKAAQKAQTDDWWTLVYPALSTIRK